MKSLSHSNFGILQPTLHCPLQFSVHALAVSFPKPVSPQISPKWHFSVQKSPSIEHEVTFPQTAVKRITSWKSCTNTRTSLFCYPIKSKWWGIYTCQMPDTVARQFQKTERSCQITNQKLPEVTKQTRLTCEQCLYKSGKRKYQKLL